VVAVAKTESYPLLPNQAFRLQAERSAREAGREVTSRAVAAAFRVSGPLNVGRFRAALSAVFARHEALRVRVRTTTGGEPRQFVDDALATGLEILDLVDPLASESTPSLEQALASRIAPFDVMNGPLVRVCLAKTGKEERALLLAIDHIICDGLSMSILLSEIRTAYQDLESLSSTGPSYRRFLEQMSASLADEDAAELISRLSPLVSTSAATFQQRVPASVGRPLGRADVFSFSLPAVLVRRARQVAAAGRATLFMLLLAAFASTWFEFSSHRRATFVTTVANRQTPGTEELVGLFANSILLTFDAGAGVGRKELLDQARTSLAVGLTDEAIPIGAVIHRAHPAEFRWGRAPYVPFEYLNFDLVQAMSTLRLGDTAIRAIDVPTLEARLTPPPSAGLGVVVSETQAGANVVVRYDTTQIETGVVRRLANTYHDRILDFIRNDYY
jgi:Condensation domain